MRYRAATRVKGLSPEIILVPDAETLGTSSQAAFTLPLQRGNVRLAGSKTAARYQRVNIGTRETHDAPARVWAAKSPNSGKAVQMASWESDQLVVVMKQGNACGAKGLASEPRSRDTSSGHRTGQRKSTKLNSMTHSTEGEEVHLKSRMREICKSGSVRGLVVDAVRRWPPALLDDLPAPPDSTHRGYAGFVQPVTQRRAGHTLVATSRRTHIGY